MLVAATGTRSSPRAEMKQLTLADVNQQQKQEPEKPAVRLVRQLGFGRRLGLGRFLPNPGFGNGGFGVGGLGNGGFGVGGLGNGGFNNGGFGGLGGGGFGGRRRFLGRRRFVNPRFFQQPLGFFG